MTAGAEAPNGEADRSPPPRPPTHLVRTGLLGPLALAAAVAVVGLVLLVQSVAIGQTRGYSPVGPSIFPFVVSLALVALGLTFAVRMLARPDPDYARDCAQEESATHWPTVGLLGIAMAVYAVLLNPVGYPLATAAFFVAGARTLGSRRLARDVLVGLAVGIVVWFAFTQLLGVRLPPGILGPVLPGG